MTLIVPALQEALTVNSYDAPSNTMVQLLFPTVHKVVMNSISFRNQEGTEYEMIVCAFGQSFISRCCGHIRHPRKGGEREDEGERKETEAVYGYVD